MRAFILLVGILFVMPAAFASMPEGIPRDLARQRAAEISNISYDLSFTLAPHAPTAQGREVLRFSLKSRQDILLDFRDGAISKLAVNGIEIPIKAENGHVELPAEKLQVGGNIVSAQFTANIAPAGKAITRYDDSQDGAEYLYTLFVPMDASMAFPCFDQPDLKARFRLAISAPTSWTVVSNTQAESFESVGKQQLIRFRETPPLSTYLFAFAAGPFRKVHEFPGMPGLYVRQSMLKRAEAEGPEVQEIASRGIRYLAAYFAQPFPFPKYDMVLIPGFPYGGMEHAGATFLREESVLFRTAPTHTDRLNRDILVLHELTHQWFRDLVTMRWFEDLWLKEGFAQFMAFQTMASLKPSDNIWKRFYESIKPGAYAIDSTQGTTPIYQDIPNLKDAKSAYGAIVYAKAPGVLKQLAFVLGSESFRNGLRFYLKEHLYSNAQWSDLVYALEQASGRDLKPWAEMWIRHRGMPQVDVAWACNGSRLARLSLAQHDVLGTQDIWPIAVQVALGYADGSSVLVRVYLSGRAVEVPGAAGKPCPAFVFANDQDYAYGRFLLDARSRDDVTDHLGKMHDFFRRTMLWGSLWESVRQADWAPRGYVDLAEKLLPKETDPSLAQTVLGHTATALHRYMSDRARQQFVPAFESMAADQMLHAPDHDLRITWFRALQDLAETTNGLAKLKELITGRLTVPGVELRSLDRWDLVTALIAMGDPEADTFLAAEKQQDRSGDAAKYAYAAEAAHPDGKIKQHYFEDYLQNVARPEDWIAQSLGAFNYWNKSKLTGEYLEPALEALPKIKRDRKIFFLVAWLNSFVGGQQSPAAQAQVFEFLQTACLDPDLRLKILQVVDELDRAVRIRRKFPE